MCSTAGAVVGMCPAGGHTYECPVHRSSLRRQKGSAGGRFPASFTVPPPRPSMTQRGGSEMRASIDAPTHADLQHKHVHTRTSQVFVLEWGPCYSCALEVFGHPPSVQSLLRQRPGPWRSPRSKRCASETGTDYDCCNYGNCLPIGRCLPICPIRGNDCDNTCNVDGKWGGVGPFPALLCATDTNDH